MGWFLTTPCLTPLTPLTISASSLTNTWPSQTKLHLSLKPTTILFVNSAVSGLLDHWLPVPLSPLSFTPNSVTVILCCVNSLGLSYPISSRSRTLLLMLMLNLLSPFIWFPSYVLSTGLKSLNTLNTSSFQLSTKFSQLPNLHTFITSSLFNLLAVLAVYLLSFLLGHQHQPR